MISLNEIDVMMNAADIQSEYVAISTNTFWFTIIRLDDWLKNGIVKKAPFEFKMLTLKNSNNNNSNLFIRHINLFISAYNNFNDHQTQIKNSKNKGYAVLVNVICCTGHMIAGIQSLGTITTVLPVF
ncbi:hypothetical protein ACTA71_002621 [Dictyostelium dimigraforme]